MPLVVAVDEDDNEVGRVGKLAAHRPPGLLHRAFSVFLYDGGSRVLLQRRAGDKQHFRGRWANACCSHPRPGEDPVRAGERRLREEMGIDATLRALGSFRYRERDPETGLVEHELDHVLTGMHDGDPQPDPAEVDAWAWIGVAELRDRIDERDPTLAPWVAHAVQAFPALLGSAPP